MDTATLKRVSDITREVYCRCVREHQQSRGSFSDYGIRKIVRYDGGVDGNGKDCPPVWPALAEFLIQNGLDAQEYIQFVFRRFGISQYPNPFQLRSARYASEFQSRSRITAAQAVKALREQFSRYNDYFADQYRVLADFRITSMGWTTAMVCQACLQDVVAGYTPIYRFIVAENNGLQEIADQYKDDALVEYHNSRKEYDAAFGQLIPVRLKEAADQLLCGYPNGVEVRGGQPVLPRSHRNIEV